MKEFKVLKQKYRQCHYIAEHSAPLSSDLLFSLSVDLKAYFWALRWTPMALCMPLGSSQDFLGVSVLVSNTAVSRGPLTSAYMSAN